MSIISRLRRPLHQAHLKGYPEHSQEPPGSDHDHEDQSESTGCQITCIDYGPTGLVEETVTDIDGFFATPRPDCSQVRWIRVIGTPDAKFLHGLGECYHFHPLALEDLIQIPQRPKVDTYSEDDKYSYLAVIASAPSMKDNRVRSQQLSIFASKRLVVSFQEFEEKTVDRIQDRLKVPSSRLRSCKGDFLMYCLLDQAVDLLFPVLEHMGDMLEKLDESVMEDPSAQHMISIHDFKRELMILRREIWPMREMLLSLKSLQTDSSSVIGHDTALYLRDVYDHCIHIADMLETYRDAITAILDIHMNMMSNKMNEVMKVLTIIATIFIPLSFLSGVFGMNFKSLPGQETGVAFIIFVTACSILGLGMLGLFWWRKWL